MSSRALRGSKYELFIYRPVNEKDLYFVAGKCECSQRIPEKDNTVVCEKIVVLPVRFTTFPPVLLALDVAFLTRKFADSLHGGRGVHPVRGGCLTKLLTLFAGLGYCIRGT